MAWIKEVCEDAVYGSCLGLMKGIFGISLFTSVSAEEIVSFKKLAIATIEKAPEFTTDALVCEGIKKGQKAALDQFTNKASPEMVAAGVVTAAELVCTKSFKCRFAAA